MDNALLISNLILWVVVIGLGILVFALVRQIGVLHERIAPAGALMVGGGPKVGEAAPEFSLQSLTGGTIDLGGVRPGSGMTLLFFLSPTCPICKTLIPALRSMDAREKDNLRVVLASDGDESAQMELIEQQSLQEYAFVLSTDLGLSYQVGKLPYAALIDEQGILRAKGLVNSREHLESLLEAESLGVSSIQDYLGQRNAS